MVLQHNIPAANASRSFHITTNLQAKSSEKLSSGYRINRAADDAAGLTISEKMRSMIRGLNRASKNAQDGYSLLQTADGALGEVQTLLQRARELSVQAATDTNTDADRAAIQSEVDELIVEINRIADTTEFNTLKLLDGSLSGSTSNISVGASVAANSLVMSGGMQSVNGGVIKNPTLTPSASAIMNPSQISNLQNSLTDIIPNAVGAIMSTFSTSFGASSYIAPSIGVEFYADSSSTLAFVACRYGYNSAGQISGIELNLSVNVNHLQFDNADHQLTQNSRESLEATIAHEMVHAFMDNDLTNGMLGATNGVIDKNNQFPGWFKEGMAQCAAGGSSPHNNWVGGGLGLNANSSAAQITAAVQSSANSLSSGTTASKYGTGYLACMYLGYLANGATGVSAQAIGSGLDKILARMARRNETLNDIIKDISGGKYTSASDFQRKFGDAASVSFIGDLLKQTAGGSGSVVAQGGLSASDILAGASKNINNYVPDFSKAYVSSPFNFTSGGSGGYSGGGKLLWLQVGSLGGQGIGISIDDAHTMALGIDDLSMKTFEEAGQAIDSIDHALEAVSANRSSIGAFMNRLEHTIANLDNTAENTQAAESRIRDTDMAEEMVTYSKNNILAQAGQAILAQANQSTQGILSILQ